MCESLLIQKFQGAPHIGLDWWYLEGAIRADKVGSGRVLW